MKLTPPGIEQKMIDQFFETARAVVAIMLAAFLNWVIPVQQMVASIFLLVVADLITGLAAAKKRNEVIHSKGLRRSTLKFGMYCVAIVSCHSVETVYFKDFPVVYMVAAYIAGTELWSVLENVGTVTGTNVLNSIREYLSRTLKKGGDDARGT